MAKPRVPECRHSHKAERWGSDQSPIRLTAPSSFLEKIPEEAEPSVSTKAAVRVEEDVECQEEAEDVFVALLRRMLALLWIEGDQRIKRAVPGVRPTRRGRI